MRLTGGLFASVATWAAIAPAYAQTTTTAPPTVNNTVASQTAVPTTGRTKADADQDAAREALLPVGARLGSFMLYPKLEGALTYNDNIYALSTKTDDFIARLSPSLDLRGDFGTVTTAVRTSLDQYKYFDATTENRTDWSIGGNIQQEYKRGNFAYLAGGYSHAHEDRGDPNSVSTDRSPTRYDLAEAGAGISSDATRFSYGGDMSYRNYNFSDNRQISGAVVNNDDRDREQYRVAGRVGYEFSPGYRLLGRAAYEKVNYDQNFDDARFNRDNKGFRATLGVQFELSRLLEGEVFAGYLNRRYRDVRFSNVGAAVYGSRLTWRPTPLTTVRADVDRNVLETVAANYRGFVATTYSLGVEHELLRTVILSASARYGRDDYKRSTAARVADRRDNNYSFNAGARYTLNRNVYAGLNYEWSKRSSNVALPGTDYNRNRVTATLGLQF